MKKFKKYFSIGPLIYVCGTLSSVLFFVIGGIFSSETTWGNIFIGVGSSLFASVLIASATDFISSRSEMLRSTIIFKQFVDDFDKYLRQTVCLYCTNPKDRLKGISLSDQAQKFFSSNSGSDAEIAYQRISVHIMNLSDSVRRMYYFCGSIKNPILESNYNLIREAKESLSFFDADPGELPEMNGNSILLLLNSIEKAEELYHAFSKEEIAISKRKA